MKNLISTVTVLVMVTTTVISMAQDAPPANAGPPARVGFQMALRTGLDVPLGKVTDAPGDDMSNSFGAQVPIFIEVGGKPIPNLFVGGYFGLGFGGTAGALKDSCNRRSVSCLGVGLRLGGEIQYHILPQGSVNPWVGYGFGFESLAVGMSANGQTGNVSVAGIEFAHLMGGVDFRLTRVFGLGPVVDFSIGQYSRIHSESPSLPTRDEDISSRATHEWFSIGVRGVFFP